METGKEVEVGKYVGQRPEWFVACQKMPEHFQSAG